ncbi:MAG: hypothetical protein AAGA57_03110 [Planctomycetota bacterium]
MAWASAHFAVGMACGAGLGSIAFVTLRRGWRYLPIPMTLGGVWALGPDLPRLFREDFPSAPFADTLSAKHLREWLHRNADWFFFHGRLDEQPREYALHGMVAIVALYLAAWAIAIAVPRRAKPHKRAHADQAEPKPLNLAA